MSQQTPPPPDNRGDADKPVTQQFSHQSVSARVPERVARGIYCTGQVILDSPKEFIIDFLQGATRPYQVVSRVVIAPSTMEEFGAALKDNLEKYSGTFGPPITPPIPPNVQRPTIQEIYEHFKLPDDLLSGAYSNSVLIGHSFNEFFFDFITGFYPTSAVSARIFMPAPQVPRFLAAVGSAMQQYKTRYRKQAEGEKGRQGEGESQNPPSAG